MIRGGEDVRDSQKLVDSLEEFRGELLSVIRDQSPLWPVFKHPSFDERNSNLVGIDPS